jgi:hypothetical protein
MELRATYKGQTHFARVEDGRLVLNGEDQYSLSRAAFAVTGTNVNGWKFWEARLPGSSRWRSMEAFRWGSDG